MNINAVIEKGQALAEQIFLDTELSVKQEDLEKNIKQLANELKKYKNARREINKLKEKKDELIVKYINKIKQPNFLDTALINYKALYFYFKKEFIEAKKILDLSDYYNGISNKVLSGVFNEKFGENKKILISIKGTNFPHLIGYKVGKEDGLCLDSKENRNFLNHIYYETNLIEDFENHGCDISKIRCVSWIWDTLKTPYMIFDQKGLNYRNTKVKTDLCFVRRVKNKENNIYMYHYVSLKKIDNSKNRYVINSHHKLTQDEFNKKFFRNKAIYNFSYEVKKAKKKGSQ